MNFNSIRLLIPIVLITLFLSACAGGGTGTATGWPGLSVDQNTAYLAYNREVYAINTSDGSQKWQYPAKDAKSNATFFNTPALSSDGQLLVGAYNNALYSLNSQNGDVLWAFPALNQSGEPSFSQPPETDRYVGSPLAGAQGIFAPNANNYLYALDSKGNLLWKYQTGGPLWARPTSDPNCTCIYLTSMDHKLYSINAQTGQANWTTSDLGGSIVGSPALSSNGVLFVGTFGSNVVAIDAETGKIIWQKNISSMAGTSSTTGQGTTSFWVWGGPTIKGDKLYFGVQGGFFFILDAASGNVIGTPFKAEGTITDSPLVTDDAIYFTTETGNNTGKVYSLDLNGKPRSGWPINFTSNLYTSPVLSGDMILIATTDANQLVVALDKNGARKWIFPPPAAPTPTGAK